MMTSTFNQCLNCNSRSHQKFCMLCGSEMVPIVYPVCKKCGNEMPDIANFCSDCGLARVEALAGSDKSA
jgi:predicted amidophosphoribosyltransferase